MSPEEFRRFGHRVVDWIADYRARVAAEPVLCRAEPGELLARLPAAPPVEPAGFDAVLRDLDDLLLPALSHWQHPRFFGYFPSNGDLASVLGDFLSTGLGVLGLAWQSAPALTELEQRTTEWLRQMLGLSDAWHGVIQDTASTGSLIAMLCARERDTTPLADKTVYTSGQAHSSIDKAVLLAGFARDRFRKVATDAAFALAPTALRAAVDADLANGLQPTAVIATTGTTTTTAIDPVDACAEVAAAHGAWLHVDAAMAGSAMILPECRTLWHGVERADSIVVNPHKWLGAAFDCSVLFVRDPDHLVRVMSTSPSYLRTTVDDRVVNYRDWGIALGRRFRALKLWSLIVTHGTARLQARLRRDLDNARWLAAEIAAASGWRLCAPVPLQTLCVRHEPAGLQGEALDAHTLAWHDRLTRSGRAWLTPAQLDGRWLVRVSIGALATERSHVEELWRDMQSSVAPAT
ncbi:MAG: aspartate aminotransferase family protein [Planctomycetes bacterium]|nr:aspartate aminotransferase family protein [Planctomycetota bacterium]